MAYQVLKLDKLDRTPPWHPFILNSELTLKSIVKNGYRFESMPCGQVQYTKQLGDTIIQYEITIDCEKYEGKYLPSKEIFEEKNNIKDMQNIAELNSVEKSKILEEEITANKFYPWKLDEIDNCYQKISWRVFNISLGKSIDSIFIRDYVHNKGGYIIESTENWNTLEGGDFMVSHNDSNLYFLCTLVYDTYENQQEKKWQFRIIRNIPHLNQKSIMKQKSWQNKRTQYYN